jgi:APA family basic amino acid/polyamine antiporter
MKLKKQLSFIDIFSIAAGAMISSGIFILPGLAFSYTGPSVFVSYFLAGVLAFIGTLSIAELATAMPKAGGDYYFVTRSLGPLIGTISGLLSWFSLSLKSAFAIFGIAEVIHVFTGIHITILAVIVCIMFVLLNMFGVKEAAKLEVILVIWLLALMTLYIILGISNIQMTNFEPFIPQGINAMLSTTGIVFVSFGGLLNVVSISEEVKNPTRNIPLGLISAVLTITVFYSLMMIITVGVLSPDALTNSFTPIADAAKQFTGNPGYIAITIAALLAFITTANAGIMSASRYPLALSLDKLLPMFISRVNKKFHTPTIALIMTGGVIGVSLFLELDVLVKAASTVILTSYILANLSVIILRESKLQNYQPSFRVPLYPWIQLFGIGLFLFLIVDMGYATIEISVGLVIAGILLYVLYGRKNVNQEYALLHLIERITNKQLTTHDLESELRDILHERDEITYDRFDKLVKHSSVLDLEGPLARETFFTKIAQQLADEIPFNSKKILTLLEEREQESSTAITPYLAIPHIIVEGNHLFKMLIARCKQGVVFSKQASSVKAVFVIIGSKDERHAHLKALAAIAQIIQSNNFEERWLQAKNENQLRDLLLLSERKRVWD